MGYWLIDWSIARWSWKYTENGMVNKSHPLSVLYELFLMSAFSLIGKKHLPFRTSF